MEAYMSRRILRHLVPLALLLSSACGSGDAAQAQHASQSTGREAVHAENAPREVDWQDRWGLNRACRG
jgi:hypothetical protein